MVQSLPRWIVVTGVVGVAIVMGLVVLVSQPDFEARRTRVDWYTLVEDDTLRLYYLGGGCTGHAEAQIEEGAESVRLSLMVDHQTSGSCDGYAEERSVDVRLDAPLYGRTVLDGDRPVSTART